MHPRHPTWILAGGVLATLLASAPAAAVSLRATTQGPPPLAAVTITGSSGTVQSHYPDATAPLAQSSATVASLTSSALGTGSDRATGSQYGSSSFSAHYQLWDPTHDVAIDANTAFLIKLQFNLRATGNVVPSPDEASVVSVRLSVTLDPDYPFLPLSTADSSIDIRWYEPGGYVVQGNAAMNGSFDFMTRVWHSNAQAGDLSFTANSTAAGAGQASLNLTLESVSLYSGGMPATGLSLRLDNGQLLPVTVSAVPEVSTGLMWCLAAAVAGVTGVRRRRAR